VGFGDKNEAFVYLMSEVIQKPLFASTN